MRSTHGIREYTPKYKLGIVAIVKNESEYICEWLAFHMVQGVDIIYLYDNDSTDGMKMVLQPFINIGYVKYRVIHGKQRQMDAYNDAVKRYGTEVQYMAFIDCDEFLMPVDASGNVTDVIETVFARSEKIGGYGVNWSIYGSSGLTKKGDGLVIERFLQRAPIDFDANTHIKSIVRPKCVDFFFNPHYCRYKKGFYGVDYEGKYIPAHENKWQTYKGLRINHYFCKSKEEYIERRSYGRADLNEKRTFDEFLMWDRNDVKDDIALRYVSKVKQIMTKYRQANEVIVSPSVKDFGLVSIIVPNYNHSRFLDERIQSVLNQTYQNFELILLDDCSQDDGASKTIFEQYRNDPHVSHIVYNNVNSGSAFSQWHKGIELAKGEYIWIAESDDSCDNTLLETLMSQITRDHAVMAFCKSLECDEKGSLSRYDAQSALDCDFVFEGTDFIKEYLIEGNIVANASSVVFRRDVAMSVDTQYTQMKGIGDWLFWIMLAERGKVGFVNEELNYFRQHSQNITKLNFITGTGAREEIIVFNYLVKNGLLKGRKKQSVWLSRTHRFTTLPYDEKTMRVLMHQWDKYHVYRFLYPLVRFKAKLQELGHTDG